jgi:hypothetical protein
MEQIKNIEEFRSKVIEEINEVRKYPQKYAEKIRKFAKYFKGKVLKIPEIIPIMTTEGAKAFEEAAKFLDNHDSRDPLKYSPGLTHVAHEALKDIQKLEDVDQLANLQIEDYIEKHGQVVGHFAQAVDFGSSLAELVVINLLVDDGDLNRGNRSNIIDDKFKLIGVSTGTHSIYHNCTVIMYARHFYSKGDTVDDNLSDDNYENDKITKKKEEIKEINKGLNIVRKSSLGKVKYVEVDEDEGKKNEADDDFDLPEGVLKIEKQEKIITEGGVKKKVIKLVKYKEDGTIETEIFKEKI